MYIQDAPKTWIVFNFAISLYIYIYTTFYMLMLNNFTNLVNLYILQ